MANVGLPQQPQNQPAESPLMGLYLDRPAFKIDPRGFSACNNVRIELNRVRSDLMGWTGAAVSQLPGSCIYLDAFISSRDQNQLIAVTPTDILFLSLGGSPTWRYMTPVTNAGFASVNNGSTSVTGTQTRWNTDIQFGDQVNVSTTASAGSTKLYIAGGYQAVPTGVTVTDLTAPGSIPAGTYLSNYGTDGGGFFIHLSQATTASITASDTLQLGSAISLRKNVRAGDQISFDSQYANLPTNTWYTVQSVNSDTSLTLTTPYSGTNLTNSVFTIRQLLTNTTSQSPAFLPACSSDNFPAVGGFNGNGPSPNDATGGADCWFFTNGIDPVVVFYSTYQPSMLYSRSVPFVCAALKQVRGLMIYSGLQESGQYLGTSIANSDNGFPQKMAGGVAFQGIATDGPFQIQRIAVLGSTVMLYGVGAWQGGPNAGDDAGGVVTSASFVGLPAIWAFSDIIRTRGPVCGGAVVEFADRHQFLAVDGQYRYNGLFIQVMNDHIWRAVMKNFDTTRPNACFAFVVPTTGDLLWTVPQLTDPLGQLYASTAFVEHYMEQANSYLFKPFTQRDFPFTSACAFANNSPARFTGMGPFNQISRSWASFGLGGNQPQYIAGDVNGNIWTLYGSNTQNGTPALSTVTWASRVVGNGRSRDLVTRVYPEIEFIASPTGPISVTLTLQNVPAGPVTITDTKTFDPTYSGNPFTSHFRRGGVAAVTISDSSGVGWVLDGYDWDHVLGGVRLA